MGGLSNVMEFAHNTIKEVEGDMKMLHIEYDEYKSTNRIYRVYGRKKAWLIFINIYNVHIYTDK